MSQLTQEETELIEKDMLAMQSEKQKPVLLFSATEFNFYQDCALKYKYAVRDSLRSIHDNRAMGLGTLIHYALEGYYKGIIQKRENPEWKNVDRSSIIEQGEQLARHKALDFDGQVVDVEEIVPQYREYTEFYAGDGWTPIAVEQPFIKVLVETEEIIIAVQAKLDLIVENITGDRIVVDHKRMSRNSSTSSLGNQFTEYAWIADAKYVTVNKIGTQKEKDKRYTRLRFEYTQEAIDEWITDTIDWAIRIHTSIKRDYFPRNRTGCDKYAGCFFRKICEAKPSERETVIKTEFIVKPREDYLAVEDENE